MHFASKMGVGTKFDCFMIGYALLNIPLLGPWKQTTDVSSAICWPVALYQLTSRRLSVDLSRLSVDMSSTTSWSAAGYKCEFGFPTAWKTDGSYVKPVFQPIGKLLGYRRIGPGLYWSVRHETGMDRLWMSHEPVVGIHWTQDAVVFIQMKIGWTR